MKIFPLEPEDCKRFEGLEPVNGLEAARKKPEEVNWLMLKGGLMGNIQSLYFSEEMADFQNLELLSCEYFSTLFGWERLRKCKKLNTLVLLGNEFRPRGLKLDLDALPQLEHLYVDIFHPVVIKMGIQQCTGLKTLWFDEVTLEGVEHLASLSELEELFIGVDDFVQLMALGDFPKLRRLKLDFCKELPQVISQLPLQTLALHSYYGDRLPDWLGQMKGLEELDLCSSQMEGLPDGFEDLKRLEICNTPLLEQFDELRERFPKVELITELS